MNREAQRVGEIVVGKPQEKAVHAIRHGKGSVGVDGYRGQQAWWVGEEEENGHEEAT